MSRCLKCAKSLCCGSGVDGFRNGTCTKGSTVNPIHTQRRSMTYAISETDLMHIATFTAESSRLYSLSGFLVGVMLDIVIAYGGSTSPFRKYQPIMPLALLLL